MNHTIPIALISSNAWAVAAAVTLQSILDHYKGKNLLEVYIYSTDMSDENIARFVAYNSDNVSVEVVKVDTSDVEQFYVEGHYVPPIAFLKARLGELLPQFDTVIYLDIDLIIKRDISPLMSIDLDGYYLAGVADMTAMVTLKWHKRMKLMRYVNTGVLVLNTKKMREDQFFQRVVATKIAHPEYQCQEQDPMNDVCEDQVKFLPVRWNLMTYNLVLNPYTLYSMAQINLFYGEDYQDFQEMEDDAAIIHLTNEYKPWEYTDCYMSREWMSIFRRSKFADCPLPLKNQPKHVAVKGGGEKGDAATHVISRKGPFVKDWTEAYTVLKLFGIPFVEKIKEGYRTRIKVLGFPFLKREWVDFEEKTYLFGLCVITRPHWSAIKQRGDELFGRLGNIIADFMPSHSANIEPYASWVRQLQRLDELAEKQ